MLRHGRRTVIGVSLIGLLLLVPAVCRADAITLIGFVKLGKHLGDLASLKAKLPKFPQFLSHSDTSDRVVDTHVAPTWWQGEPEVLDALFSGKRLESSREAAATRDYLAARLYDFAGDKVTAYYAYLSIQQENEGCPYWETATLLRRELEPDVVQPVSRHCSTDYDFLLKDRSGPSPEAKAMQDACDRACSLQHVLVRPMGSQHPFPTPVDALRETLDKPSERWCPPGWSLVEF